MKRTELLQGLRMMKFVELNGRVKRRCLTQGQAAEILGVSERTFRRWRDREEADGAEGLYDKRLGKISGRRIAVDLVMKALDLFDTRYFDFTSKHFWEKLVRDHGFKVSYNWTRLLLQARGRKQKAKSKGAHRRKRPRRALPGMMIHQDGSSHEWVAGAVWDLIVTMDDATSEIYSAFFVEEEGTMSSFRGISEVIAAKGLFSSFYSDRGSHYWHTPSAGGKVDRDNLTQAGRALKQLMIEHIPAYSPEARGRSERMFGTLQNRLPQELRVAGIRTMEEANHYLTQTYMPDHNRRFSFKPESEGSAFVACAGSVEEVLCVHEERIVGHDNTVRYKGHVLQIPPDRHRHHYVKAKVTVREYPDGRMAIFHGPRRLAAFGPNATSEPEPIKAAA